MQSDKQPQDNTETGIFNSIQFLFYSFSAFKAALEESKHLELKLQSLKFKLILIPNEQSQRQQWHGKTSWDFL